VGTRCADHVTPLYPQKLALTSPTGGGRFVGIVRVRTKATEYYRLNMFRALLCPSSGGRDYNVDYHIAKEVCHPRCVCENWKGYVVKHNCVN